MTYLVAAVAWTILFLNDMIYLVAIVAWAILSLVVAIILDILSSLFPWK